MVHGRVVLCAELLQFFNGQGGIRTLGTLTGTPVFETGRFNRSRTCPDYQTLRR